MWNQAQARSNCDQEAHVPRVRYAAHTMHIFQILTDSFRCDTCRKQKEKCEGGQPCWRCQRLDRQCHFSAPPATRRPNNSPGDDLLVYHSLEHSNRHQRNLEQIVQHFLGDVDLDEENVARIATTCATKSKEMENSLDVTEESFDVHFVSKDVACSLNLAIVLAYLQLTGSV